MNHEDYIRFAMEQVELAVKEGQEPFGVVVVDPLDQVVWKDHDRQKEFTDPTAHGEINAIRALCKKFNSLSLKNYRFYTTSEPCPTCMTAMIKAQISFCGYGAKTEVTASLPIPAETIVTYSKKYPIKVMGGILEQECLAQRNRLLTL